MRGKFIYLEKNKFCEIPRKFTDYWNSEEISRSYFFGERNSKNLFSTQLKTDSKKDEAINQASSMRQQEKAQDGASQERTQEIEMGGIEADRRLCLLYLWWNVWFGWWRNLANSALWTSLWTATWIGGTYIWAMIPRIAQIFVKHVIFNTTQFSEIFFSVWFQIFQSKLYVQTSFNFS